MSLSDRLLDCANRVTMAGGVGAGEIKNLLREASASLVSLEDKREEADEAIERYAVVRRAYALEAQARAGAEVERAAAQRMGEGIRSQWIRALDAQTSERKARVAAESLVAELTAERDEAREGQSRDATLAMRLAHDLHVATYALRAAESLVERLRAAISQHDNAMDGLGGQFDHAPCLVCDYLEGKAEPPVPPERTQPPVHGFSNTTNDSGSEPGSLEGTEEVPQP